MKGGGIYGSKKKKGYKEKSGEKESGTKKKKGYKEKSGEKENNKKESY
ncbi:MAG: hypothetical protein ABIE43_00530 [Patescibacteria group bacterium]